MIHYYSAQEVISNEGLTEWTKAMLPEGGVVWIPDVDSTLPPVTRIPFPVAKVPVSPVAIMFTFPPGRP